MKASQILISYTLFLIALLLDATLGHGTCKEGRINRIVYSKYKVPHNNEQNVQSSLYFRHLIQSHNNPVELVSYPPYAEKKMEISGPGSHGQCRASESGSH